MNDSWIGSISLDIDVKYHHNNINHIIKNPKGDWYDLYAVKVILKNKKEIIELDKKDYIPRNYDYGLISLGVSMKLPEGYEALVTPRSSTYKEYSFIQTNSVGVIDNSYNGTDDIWYFPFACHNNNYDNKALQFNDAICQFKLIENMPKINFNIKEELNSVNRNGFGSTGRQGKN